MVGGNLVVGIVIFLIITIVQFIVITKGAERVAEVGARFTLDAMPGKQMSIDARHARRRHRHANEARRRRSGLEKESQLYGAMDGAMKFVKGDAIAGIIITAINIIGGLAIGVLQQGMPLEKALNDVRDPHHRRRPRLADSGAVHLDHRGDHRHARLLGGERGLGGEIGRQLLGQPKALLIGALCWC